MQLAPRALECAGHAGAIAACRVVVPVLLLVLLAGSPAWAQDVDPAAIPESAVGQETIPSSASAPAPQPSAAPAPGANPASASGANPAPAPGASPASERSGDPVVPASLLPAAGTVDIQIDVQPTRVLVGRPVTLTFTLTYPEGTRAYFPDNPAVAPFVSAGQRRTSQGVLGQGTGETHVLELLPVRPGRAAVGPFEIAFVDPAGQAGIAKTPRIDLDVATTLGDEVAPELASAGTPVPVRVRNEPLIWGLSALGVAIVAAGLGILGYRRWRKWRDARRPLPPPIPAHERALAALADLELLGLGRDGDWRELALRVSEIVREFLGERVGFNGVEATSYEVIRDIRGRDLGRMTPERIEDLLSLCDLIKFAKYRPSDAEGVELVPRARDVVLGVMTAVEGQAGTGTAVSPGQAGTGTGPEALECAGSTAPLGPDSGRGQEGRRQAGGPGAASSRSSPGADKGTDRDSGTGTGTGTGKDTGTGTDTDTGTDTGTATASSRQGEDAEARGGSDAV